MQDNTNAASGSTSERIQKAKEKMDAQNIPMADPQDLVYSGGYSGDPREIVENPAVTPEMINEPGDLRGDMNEQD